MIETNTLDSSCFDSDFKNNSFDTLNILWSRILQK